MTRERGRGTRITLAIGLLALLASSLPAQAGREIHRTPWGLELDFHADGAWRVRARRVAESRARLVAQGDFAALNAQALVGTTTVSGVLSVPAVLFRFHDMGTASGRPAPEYQAYLFGAAAPAGRPYTIRTFYGELSDGRLDLQGAVMGWVTLPGAETAYTDTAGACPGNPHGTNNCNGVFSSRAFSLLQQGLRQALQAVDPLIDFREYDNDGRDGVPNSGDDDGFVDLVVFVHSERDGACVSAENNHIWAHRASALSGFPSNDAAAAGGQIRFRDYVIQSGLGGQSGCHATQVMGIGTTAHEIGHAFGLPDLYDTGFTTEGVGEFDLMGSGNWTTQFSPSRMSAWSLNELGWVALSELTASGTYRLGPAPTADSAYLIRLGVPNQSGEYLLLENRQGVQADSAMTRVHCGRSRLSFPAECGGGLAIWHIDSARVAAGRAGSSNSVNVGSTHGVAVLQADGLNSLRKPPLNRGDAGDLWPGAAGRAVLSFSTAPPLRRNADAGFAGFEIDSIRIDGQRGAATFRVTIGPPTIVQATDTAATITVDGAPHRRFIGILPPGSSHSVAIDSAQVGADGRRQYVFESWSDGGLRAHEIVIPATGDTVVATIRLEYQLQVTSTGPGEVTAASGIDLGGGTFLAAGAPETLVAVPDSGQRFGGWSGDITASGDTLEVIMAQPLALTATFFGPVTVAAAGPPAGQMGAPYSYNFQASGGTGAYSWSLDNGALPPGLTLFTTGRLSGIPSDTGLFTARVAVAAGDDRAAVDVAIAVTAPALDHQAVVRHLVGPGPGLTPAQLTYLDLVGNRNGRFDVGDFHAWLEAAGHVTAARARGPGGGL